MKSIVVKIKALAASERKITAKILDCIREIEAQKIHFEMGYPGLLEFLVQECGYSESSAFRRINAARLTAQVPGLRADLQSGNLTLTQVSTAARGFRQKEKLGKTLSLEEKTEVLSALKNKSSFESQQITAKLLELPVLSQEKIKPQADESMRLEMTLSKEEIGLVQRAREILGHVSPGMSWKELLVFMARDLIKRRDPAREVRARAQKPSMGQGQGQGQDKNQNLNQNQNQVQNQSQNYSQRRSQSQSNNPNKIQEQGLGDKFLVKRPGLNLENRHFDKTTQVPLASAELAAAQLLLSSGLRCRTSAPELAPPPVLNPSPAKSPMLEHRSSATLARWVNLSNLRSGAQIQGGKLQGSELPRSELLEAEPLRAEPPRAEMAETEVPKSHQPMFELSVCRRNAI